jgi:hypothetical protein
VNREEIRKFKNAWADIDVNRTGYIQQKDYVRFWKVKHMTDQNMVQSWYKCHTYRMVSAETEWNVRC